MTISNVKYSKEKDVLEFDHDILGCCEIDQDGDFTTEDFFSYIPISDIKEIVRICCDDIIS